MTNFDSRSCMYGGVDLESRVLMDDGSKKRRLQSKKVICSPMAPSRKLLSSFHCPMDPPWIRNGPEYLYITAKHVVRDNETWMYADQLPAGTTHQFRTEGTWFVVTFVLEQASSLIIEGIEVFGLVLENNFAFQRTIAAHPAALTSSGQLYQNRIVRNTLKGAREGLLMAGDVEAVLQWGPLLSPSNSTDSVTSDSVTYEELYAYEVAEGPVGSLPLNGFLHLLDDAGNQGVGDQAEMDLN